MQNRLHTRVNSALGSDALAKVLEALPVGITVIDREGRILYYNAYCARYVDRKPEYIGRDIRSCHQRRESIAMIDNMLADLDAGRHQEVAYEAERNGIRLSVRMRPFEVGGKRIGYIQCFTCLP
ncbi:MAG: PAS domain-containing protein [Desulfosarcinaceae bacterium]|nr:PAS domain-containing protein [Desulfosarcinaceae bacterium]